MTTPKTKFQQRHYEAVAEVVQKLGDTIRLEAANRLADMFEADNRMFQRSRFLAACVPGANVRSRRTPGPAMPYTNVDRGWPLTRKA